MTKLVIQFDSTAEYISFKEILKHSKADYDINFPSGNRSKKMTKDYKFLIELMEKCDNDN